MAKYRLSNEAKEDLIRIHHYGVEKFGMAQADKYFDSFFEYFDIIANTPFSFEAVDFIKVGFRLRMWFRQHLLQNKRGNCGNNGNCRKAGFKK